MSARRTPAILMAEAPLADATVSRVLDLAAPLAGQSAASLHRPYQLGTVTITDLVLIKGGHRVSSRHFEFIMVDERVAN